MAKFTYTGNDERVFPTISTTVQPNDTFDAPDDFSAPDVSSSKVKPTPTPAPQESE
jgi:hypothetical protein